jgi:hypothetical protein
VIVVVTPSRQGQDVLHVWVQPFDRRMRLVHRHVAAGPWEDIAGKLSNELQYVGVYQ